MKGQLRLLARAIKYRYKLDPAEIRWMLRTVRAGWCALDLGAHKGAYAYWLARAVGRHGRVVCVEAQQHLAEHLAGIMRNRPQVFVKWAAASDATGLATLSLRADGSSHGASVAGFADGRVGKAVRVPAVTIADLIEEFALPSIDFIKCDVEGHERAVFAAARHIVDEYRPIVLVECEERHTRDGGAVRELADIFTPLRYDIRFFCAGRLLPLAEFDPERHQRYGRGEYCNNFLVTPVEKSGAV
jgi:FkbM family methyltransferase